MDIGKLIISTALRQVKKSNLPSLSVPLVDAVLGAAVKSIDVDRFEDEYDRSRIIEVESVEVKTLEDRLDLLAKITRQAALSMPIRQKAADITSACSNDDKPCIAQSVFNFVKSSVSFREEYTEQFFDPRLYVRVTDRLTVADCDDYTSLISSILLASGVGVGEEKIIWRVTGQNDIAAHVYPLAPMGRDNYLAMDATLNQPLGYDVSQHDQQLIMDYVLN
jgi:hypothetical protein